MYFLVAKLTRRALQADLRKLVMLNRRELGAYVYLFNGPFSVSGCWWFLIFFFSSLYFNLRVRGQELKVFKLEITLTYCLRLRKVVYLLFRSWTDIVEIQTLVVAAQEHALLPV